MTAGGEVRRPVLPPVTTAGEPSAAPEHEGHERTGVTVHVALHDHTDAPAVAPPTALRDDGRRVAAAPEQWGAVLGGAVLGGAVLGGAVLGSAVPGGGDVQATPPSVGDRPPVVLAVSDGFADHARVAAPVLDALGVPGWFHLTTGYLDAAPEDQSGAARRWDEVAALAERPDLGAHTATHASATDVRTAGDLEREVPVPLRRVHEVTGRPPASATWPGGAPFDPGHPADQAARKAGVRFSVSGLGYGQLNQ